MAKIPKVLQEHINKAFPENVCLVATALPNGFAQVTPRGSTMVFDDEHIACGNGAGARPMRIFARAARSRSFFEIRNCGLTAHCPPAVLRGFTARPRSTSRALFTTRSGGALSSPRRTATPRRRDLRS